MISTMTERPIMAEIALTIVSICFPLLVAGQQKIGRTSHPIDATHHAKRWFLLEM
jgi:hypothetical protein